MLFCVQVKVFSIMFLISSWVYFLCLMSMSCLLNPILPLPMDCSNSMRYYRSDMGSWEGHLSIKVPKSGLPVNVVCIMSLQAVLASKYVGLIELTESPEKVYKMYYDGRAKQFNYTIRFPLPFPLPRLEKITVNDIIYCQSKPVPGLVITKITLEHLFPTKVHLLNPGYIKSKYEDDLLCGFSSWSGKDEFDAQEIGAWPWLAALLLRNAQRFELHCSGSLISLNHVLTAAHCLSNELFPGIDLSSVFIYMGKHQLDRIGEPQSQLREVEDVTLHPGFSVKHLIDDLAVVTLKEPAYHSLYVKPVCFWSGQNSLDWVIGKVGSIVGWSGVKGGITPYPRLIQVPVVNQEECLRSQESFMHITSERTFCAGFRNGSGPCNGDSGGGLMFNWYNPVQKQETWFIRGIVAHALLNSQNSCNLYHYVVFTDVAKYSDWIRSVIDKY